MLAQLLDRAAQRADLVRREDLAQHERAAVLEAIDLCGTQRTAVAGRVVDDGVDALHEGGLRHAARIEIGIRRGGRGRHGRPDVRADGAPGEERAVTPDAVLDPRQAQEVPEEDLLRAQHGLAELVLERVEQARSARAERAARDDERVGLVGVRREREAPQRARRHGADLLVGREAEVAVRDDLAAALAQQREVALVELVDVRREQRGPAHAELVERREQRGGHVGDPGAGLRLGELALDVLAPERERERRAGQADDVEPADGAQRGGRARDAPAPGLVVREVERLAVELDLLQPQAHAGEARDERGTLLVERQVGRQLDASQRRAGAPVELDRDLAIASGLRQHGHWLPPCVSASSSTYAPSASCTSVPVTGGLKAHTSRMSCEPPRKTWRSC